MEYTPSSVLKSQLVYLRLEHMFRNERLSALAAAHIWLHVPPALVQPSAVPVV